MLQNREILKNCVMRYFFVKKRLFFTMIEFQITIIHESGKNYRDTGTSRSHAKDKFDMLKYRRKHNSRTVNVSEGLIYDLRDLFFSILRAQ